MLNEQDFAAWGERISLSDAARSVVAHFRGSQPTRRVGSRRCLAAATVPVTHLKQRARMLARALRKLGYDVAITPMNPATAENGMQI
jgi:hypothetical protein